MLTSWKRSTNLIERCQDAKKRNLKGMSIFRTFRNAQNLNKRADRSSCFGPLIKQSLNFKIFIESMNDYLSTAALAAA